MHKIINKNCNDALKEITDKIDLSFLDPPFNQDKDYTLHNDKMDEDEYWNWMKDVCKNLYNISNDGAALYFMQREKNAEFVLKAMRESGWLFRNLIIWKKLTSAVPLKKGYGKNYQIIAFGYKNEIKTFNKLRIDPPLPENYKYKRENGMYATDIWDDIRELTSGFFAGKEAIRNDKGERFHKQQSPIALLLRIILSSTKVDDIVCDPFSGTGTTAVVAKQLRRGSISIEIDPENVKCIENRLKKISDSDDISKYYKDYTYTNNLDEIWGKKVTP